MSEIPQTWKKPKDYVNPEFIKAYSEAMYQNYIRKPLLYNTVRIVELYKTWDNYAHQLAKGILVGTANISSQAKEAAQSLGFGANRKGVLEAIQFHKES